MELYQASHQWATRPNDERFSSLESLYTATKHYADIATEREGIPYNTLRVEPQERDVMLVGRGNTPAHMTHWAFGQLSSKLNAPASFLRTLPPTLACQILNHRLKANAQQLSERDANLLVQENGKLVVRSITSEKYERVWNHEVVARLIEMQGQGWAPARPTFRHKGDDRPALYASDHDMFAFLMMPNVQIEQPVRSLEGQDAPLYKGVIAWNSEVGGSVLGMMTFWFNAMCGNHIIWGASGVVELKAKHVGTIRERAAQWDIAIRKYADQSTMADQQRIVAAANMKIAATKQELLDVLFGKRFGLSRKAIEGSYEACLPEQDGSPLTVWGFVQGATRYSQTVKFADERTEIDRAAARVMAMAF